MFWNYIPLWEIPELVDEIHSLIILTALRNYIKVRTAVILQCCMKATYITYILLQTYTFSICEID